MRNGFVDAKGKKQKLRIHQPAPDVVVGVGESWSIEVERRIAGSAGPSELIALLDDLPSDAFVIGAFKPRGVVSGVRITHGNGWIALRRGELRVEIDALAAEDAEDARSRVTTLLAEAVSSADESCREPAAKLLKPFSLSAEGQHVKLVGDADLEALFGLMFCAASFGDDAD